MSNTVKLQLYNNELKPQKKKLVTLRFLEEDRERLKTLAKSQNKSLQRFCFDILMSNFDK